MNNAFRIRSAKLLLRIFFDYGIGNKHTLLDSKSFMKKAANLRFVLHNVKFCVFPVCFRGSSVKTLEPFRKMKRILISAPSSDLLARICGVFQ